MSQSYAVLTFATSKLTVIRRASCDWVCDVFQDAHRWRRRPVGELRRPVDGGKGSSSKRERLLMDFTTSYFVFDPPPARSSRPGSCLGRRPRLYLSLLTGRVDWKQPNFSSTLLSHRKVEHIKKCVHITDTIGYKCVLTVNPVRWVGFSSSGIY